jgi:hypothetical protein
MKPTTLLPLLSATNAAIWQPALKTKFQIIISGTPQITNSLAPPDTPVWDVDLFTTPKSTIDALRSQGKKVVCYLSAGTSETWRPDFSSFRQADLGLALPCWEGEQYLDIRSESVWEVMRKRIDMARGLGCDAIDPDNLGESVFLCFIFIFFFC